MQTYTISIYKDGTISQGDFAKVVTRKANTGYEALNKQKIQTALESLAVNIQDELALAKPDIELLRYINEQQEKLSNLYKQGIYEHPLVEEVLEIYELRVELWN
jgi:hypothetical protein